MGRREQVRIGSRGTNTKAPKKLDDHSERGGSGKKVKYAKNGRKLLLKMR